MHGPMYVYVKVSNRITLLSARVVSTTVSDNLRCPLFGTDGSIAFSSNPIFESTRFNRPESVTSPLLLLCMLPRNQIRATVILGSVCMYVRNTTRVPYQFQSLAGCKRQHTMVVVCFPTHWSEYLFPYGDVGKAPRTP
jgi:hypothetical protein